MAMSLKKKEKNVKGDQCDPAKDPPTIKSVFSLRTYLGWMGFTPFIES